MSFDVRPAKPADIATVRAIADRAWHSAHGPIIGEEVVEEFLAKYYDAESFRSLIEDDVSIFAVATDMEDDVVGFASARPDDEDPGTFHLGRIYVHPNRWEEGVGQRLLDHVEQTVERRDGARIELGVMAENDRAVSFYESAGYRLEAEFYDEQIDTESYTYTKSL